MQFQSPGKPPVGIVFDADLGNTIDDALALAMLFGFQGRNESRVLSVSTTKSSLNAAIFADVLVRFYTGEAGPFAPAMPTGPPPTLGRVLARPGAPPSIAQKVRPLVVAAHALTMSDTPAARRLFAEWP